MNFLDLADDVLIQILKELCLHDVLSIRKTCKAASSITRNRSVWYHLLDSAVIQQYIPIYRFHNQSLPTLTSSELELSVSNSLLLDANWTSETPTYTSHVVFDAFPPSPRSRVVTVQFLPERLSRWLISIGSTTYGDHLIQCWDTYASPPLCVTSKCYPIFPRVIINSDSSHIATISATLFSSRTARNETVLFSLDATAQDPGARLVPLKNVQHSFPDPLLLQGSLLVFSDSECIVHVVDVDTDTLIASLLHPPPTNSHADEYKCLRVFLAKNTVITFCKFWIFLYRLPEQMSTSPAPTRAAQLDPESSFKWQWKIDSIVFSPRIPQPYCSYLSSCDTTTVPSLNLVIRFDSWFPWPVNIIHHFILPSIWLPPPHRDHHGQSTHAATLCAPMQVTSISSLIRLFSNSDMVLGPYGTLLWIDSQVDVVASENGQRIAAKMLLSHIPVVPAQTTYLAGEGGGLMAVADALASGSATDLAMMNAMAHSNELSSPALRPPPPKRHRHDHTIRFQVQEDKDIWTCLAVDEESGRFAVGSILGTISIFDYSPHRALR